MQDNKWRSLNEQRNDPSAYDDIDLGLSETNVNTNDSQEPVLARNIPPYDPTADTSEKAYLLDEIIPKNMRQHLLEIVNHFESGEIFFKGYGSFVSKRVHKLKDLQVIRNTFFCMRKSSSIGSHSFRLPCNLVVMVTGNTPLIDRHSIGNFKYIFFLLMEFCDSL